MAHRVVAERDVVAVGNQRLVVLAYGQGDEVIRLAFQRRCDPRRDSGDHPLQIKRVDRDLAGRGVTNTVGRL